MVFQIAINTLLAIFFVMVVIQVFGKRSSVLSLFHRRKRNHGNLVLVGRQPDRCPLCGRASRLEFGTSLRFRRYTREDGDKMMQIIGCPSCMHGNNVQKTCPVCKKIVATNSVIYGEMTQSPNIHAQIKKHLMIIGCSSCMPHLQKHRPYVTT